MEEEKKNNEGCIVEKLCAKIEILEKKINILEEQLRGLTSAYHVLYEMQRRKERIM